jgi:hypothetical protein
MAEVERAMCCFGGGLGKLPLVGCEVDSNNRRGRAGAGGSLARGHVGAAVSLARGHAGAGAVYTVPLIVSRDK